MVGLYNKVFGKDYEIVKVEKDFGCLSLWGVIFFDGEIMRIYVIFVNEGMYGIVLIMILNYFVYFVC